VRKEMIDFIKWCENKNLPLPLDENQTRSGIRGQYPDGYIRSQYPPGYFAPTSATWKLDLKQAKDQRSVKDVVNSPL